jgi:hypothetical protein
MFIPQYYQHQKKLFLEYLCFSIKLNTEISMIKPSVLTKTQSSRFAYVSNSVLLAPKKYSLDVYGP